MWDQSIFLYVCESHWVSLLAWNSQRPLSISRMLRLQECGSRVDLVVLEIYLFTNMKVYICVSLCTALCGSKRLHTFSRSRGHWLRALLHHTLRIPLERGSLPEPGLGFLGVNSWFSCFYFSNTEITIITQSLAFSFTCMSVLSECMVASERNLDPLKLNYKSCEPPCRCSE